MTSSASPDYVKCRSCDQEGCLRSLPGEAELTAGLITTLQPTSFCISSTFYRYDTNLGSSINSNQRNGISIGSDWGIFYYR